MILLSVSKSYSSYNTYWYRFRFVSICVDGLGYEVYLSTFMAFVNVDLLYTCNSSLLGRSKKRDKPLSWTRHRVVCLLGWLFTIERHSSSRFRLHVMIILRVL